jgi:hypothetical protein
MQTVSPAPRRAWSFAQSTNRSASLCFMEQAAAWQRSTARAAAQQYHRCRLTLTGLFTITLSSQPVLGVSLPSRERTALSPSLSSIEGGGNGLTVAVSVRPRLGTGCHALLLAHSGGVWLVFRDVCPSSRADEAPDPSDRCVTAVSSCSSTDNRTANVRVWGERRRRAGRVAGRSGGRLVTGVGGRGPAAQPTSHDMWRHGACAAARRTALGSGHRVPVAAVRALAENQAESLRPKAESHP